jgi:hypothetical protein
MRRRKSFWPELSAKLVMKERDVSKRLTEKEIFENALYSMIPGVRDWQFLWPDEQATRAIFIIALERDLCKGVLKVWRRYTEIWGKRSMTKTEGTEMNSLLLRELACLELSRGDHPGSKLIMSELTKAAKNGNLLDVIMRLAMSLRRKEEKPSITKLEHFLIRYWADDGKIGSFSFPPLCMFSAENLCDFLHVALKMSDLTPAALRKTLKRKLRLTPLPGPKVSSTALTRKLLQLRNEECAIETFNKGLMAEIESLDKS